MKVTTKMRRYHFGTTFKVGDTGILILAAIGVLGGVILFMLGMAWILMGAYQQEAVNDKHIAWGLVMLCLGGYLVLMNAISIVMSALALNQRNPQKTLWIAIFAIFALVPLIPGIVLLFTPLQIDAEKNPLIVTDEFTAHDKERLQSLKLRMDHGSATDAETQEFKYLLSRYRQTKRVN